MKHLFVLILLVITSFFNLISQNTKNEYIIGTEKLLDSGLPIHPSFHYSYTQNIYLQSEIGDADIISKIWFEFGGSTLEHSNDWTIYIGHTSKTEFENSADWIDVSTLTEVYSEIFPNPTEKGWIEFDITDFNYNGTDNLIIAVNEKSPKDDGFSENRFYTSSVTSRRSILDYSDSESLDPENPPTNSLTKAIIPNLKYFKGSYPDVDGFLTKIVSPTGFDWIWHPQAQDIIVSLQNKGIANLTEATLSWSVNGVAQTDYNWTGNLAPSETEEITIGNYDFGSIDEYSIAVDVNVNDDGNDSNNTQTAKYETLNSFRTNYVEGFESYFYQDTPGYFTLETHSVAWMVETADYSHTGENCLATFYNTDGVTAKDDWAFLPFLRLVGGENYQISFWVYGEGWDGVPESLDLFVSTEANSASATDKLWSKSDFLSEDWENFTVSYTPSVTDNYTFGFHANSVADVNDILIDDIAVKGATASIINLSKENIEIFPNPTTGKLYINCQDSYRLEIVDITGKIISQTNINKSGTVQIDRPGLYFLRFSNSKTSVSTKVIVE